MFINKIKVVIFYFGESHYRIPGMRLLTPNLLQSTKITNCTTK